MVNVGDDGYVSQTVVYSSVHNSKVLFLGLTGRGEILPQTKIARFFRLKIININQKPRLEKKIIIELFTRLRRKPRSPDRGGMRVSSEALAKEDWSFGGLRRTIGATGSCPWGSTEARLC